MKDAENAGKAGGGAFESYARALISGDRGKLTAAISELVARGNRDDCENIAVILSYSTDGGGSGDYYSARYGSSFDKRYLDLFLDLCREGGIPESEYIKVLLAAGSADKSGALYRWNTAVDVYLTRRATDDFDEIADYIDKYDGKYTKYGVLIKINETYALERLVRTVMYGKNVNKTAIRDVLMDYGELAEPLMSLYGKSKAKERAAIARLLSLYKNDASVKQFIEETVAVDKSKTVRSVLPRVKKRAGKLEPVRFFEQAMINGDTYKLSELREILKNAECAAVADRLFFFAEKPDGIQVILYDGGVFLDMTDTPLELSDADRIGVLHPVNVPSDVDILSLKVSQPFKQIARRTFSPSRGGANNALVGTLSDRGDFDVAFKKCGFALCGKRSASECDAAIKFVGDYAVGVECDFSEANGTVACGRINYYRRENVVKLNKTYYVQSSDCVSPTALPRREFSELTLSAYTLFGRE